MCVALSPQLSQHLLFPLACDCCFRPPVSSAMFAHNVREIVRKQLRHAPPGVATVDIPAAVAEKKAAEAAKASA